MDVGCFCANYFVNLESKFGELCTGVGFVLLDVGDVCDVVGGFVGVGIY